MHRTGSAFPSRYLLIRMRVAIGDCGQFCENFGRVRAANLAYSALVSLFPLLLILVTVLGLAVSGGAAGPGCREIPAPGAPGRRAA